MLLKNLILDPNPDGLIKIVSHLFAKKRIRISACRKNTDLDPLLYYSESFQSVKVRNDGYCVHAISCYWDSLPQEKNTSF